jgi:hypothetical protein
VVELLLKLLLQALLEPLIWLLSELVVLLHFTILVTMVQIRYFLPLPQSAVVAEAQLAPHQRELVKMVVLVVVVAMVLLQMEVWELLHKVLVAQ